MRWNCQGLNNFCEASWQALTGFQTPGLCWLQIQHCFVFPAKQSTQPFAGQIGDVHHCWTPRNLFQQLQAHPYTKLHHHRFFTHMYVLAMYLVFQTCSPLSPAAAAGINIRRSTTVTIWHHFFMELYRCWDATLKTSAATFLAWITCQQTSTFLCYFFSLFNHCCVLLSYSGPLTWLKRDKYPTISCSFIIETRIATQMDPNATPTLLVLVSITTLNAPHDSFWMLLACWGILLGLYSRRLRHFVLGCGSGSSSSNTLFYNKLNNTSQLHLPHGGGGNTYPCFFVPTAHFSVKLAKYNTTALHHHHKKAAIKQMRLWRIKHHRHAPVHSTKPHAVVSPKL